MSQWILHSLSNISKPLDDLKGEEFCRWKEWKGPLEGPSVVVFLADWKDWNRAPRFLKFL